MEDTLLKIDFKLIFTHKKAQAFLLQFLHKTQILYERTMKDTDVLNQRFSKLQQDYEQQLISCDSLAQENQTRVVELKVIVMKLLFCFLFCPQISTRFFHFDSKI